MCSVYFSPGWRPGGHLLCHEVDHDVALFPGELAVFVFGIITSVTCLSFDRFNLVQRSTQKAPGQLMYCGEMVDSHTWTGRHQ